MIKIIFTEEQTKEIIDLYSRERVGLIDVGNIYNVSRNVIKRILTENNCLIRSDMSSCHLGQKPWNKGKKWSLKMRKSLSLKALALKRQGTKNPNWKGGRPSIRDKRRNMSIVKIWKEKCLKRDKACRMCGDIERLEVNHIIPLRNIQDIKTLIDINNGIVLCRKCHNKIHWHEEEYIEHFREIINC